MCWKDPGTREYLSVTRRNNLFFFFFFPFWLFWLQFSTFHFHLCQVHPEGKYVVDIGADIDIAALTPTVRVALRNDSYQLHKVLPNKVDPLVSLMMVEKVPDSTYEMVGGLDKQIKEIKEVIELPVKHPELFEALGIAQPKVRGLPATVMHLF